MQCLATHNYKAPWTYIANSFSLPFSHTGGWAQERDTEDTPVGMAMAACPVIAMHVQEAAPGQPGQQCWGNRWGQIMAPTLYSCTELSKQRVCLANVCRSNAIMTAGFWLYLEPDMCDGKPNTTRFS